MERTICIEKVFTHLHAHNLANEHIVAAKLQHLPHLAGKIGRAFRNGRRIHQTFRRHGMQPGGGKLIPVLAGANAAIVQCLAPLLIHQIDHKFAAFLDHIMRVAILADTD